MRKRIFWAELLEELATARTTQKEIAAKVSSSQPAISRLAKGGTEEPPYSVGEALLKLHLAVCGEEKHAALLSKHAEEAPPEQATVSPSALPAGVDRRDPTRPSPYAGTDIDRRVTAGEI